jgi:glucosamine-6-phosphate deaminase
MRILVLPTADGAARAVARFLARVLRDQPDSVLALPTGRTMIPVYGALAALHRRGQFSLARATTFNLDEFVGLPPGHPGSFRTFMRRHLFDGVDAMPRRIHFPDGTGRRPEAYEAAIARSGGLDVCLLGLGDNGHVGFNEPADHLASSTHLVRLQLATRKANAYLFDGRLSLVPKQAVSVGMATILNARTVILLATGRRKAQIVRRAFAGPITTRVPASLIQMHPNALVVLDAEAATRLPA